MAASVGTSAAWLSWLMLVYWLSLSECFASAIALLMLSFIEPLNNFGFISLVRGQGCNFIHAIHAKTLLFNCTPHCYQQATQLTNQQEQHMYSRVALPHPPDRHPASSLYLAPAVRARRRAVRRCSEQLRWCRIDGGKSEERIRTRPTHQQRNKRRRTTHTTTVTTTITSRTHHRTEQQPAPTRGRADGQLQRRWALRYTGRASQCYHGGGWPGWRRGSGWRLERR